MFDTTNVNTNTKNTNTYRSLNWTVFSRSHLYSAVGCYSQEFHETLFWRKRLPLIFTKTFASCTMRLCTAKSLLRFLLTQVLLAHSSAVWGHSSLYLGHDSRTCGSASRISSDSWNGSSDKCLRVLLSLQWEHTLFNIAPRFVFPCL